MSTTLGVLPHGPVSKLGWPFNQLFNNSKLVTKPEDLLDVQAVVLWGGEDISPSLYGEKPCQFTDGPEMPSKRDLFEWSILLNAVKLNIPIIGVCRGAQLMCAFDGGKLAQDVNGHGQSHTICTEHSAFYAPAEHHQMMLPKEGARILAHPPQRRAQFYVSENNTINYFPANFVEPEAVFFPDIKGIGFQFHPEWATKDDPCVKWTLDITKEKLL